MAEASSLQPTSTVVQTERNTQSSPAVKLKLQKPQTDKKVKWEEGTVDNEHMNKKKSKCCCIYEKPKVFGESSSDSDNSDSEGDCTGNCRGHKNKCFRKMPGDEGAEQQNDAAGASGAASS